MTCVIPAFIVSAIFCAKKYLHVTTIGATIYHEVRMGRSQEQTEHHMKKKSKTDWARVKAMKDSEIDYSDSTPLDKDFFKKAVLWPGTKKQITLRLDPDVVEFFKKKGRGYQSMINAVLRKYVEARIH